MQILNKKTRRLRHTHAGIPILNYVEDTVPKIRNTNSA